MSQTQTQSVTAKRAQWEDMVFVVPCKGKVNVANVSHGEDNAKNHTYTVSVEDGEAVKCTCPDHKYRNRKCKHMQAVENSDETMAAAGEDDVCENCGDMIDLPCFEHFEMA